MEQIYQIMWVILIISVTLNAITYYVAPSYICVNGVCPKELSETATAGMYDLNQTKNILTETTSGAVSGSTPTTPTGFWAFLSGTATEIITGKPAGGLIGIVLVPIISFVAPIQVLSFYYADTLDIQILKNIVLVFIAILTIIQIIGIIFFIIYIAGLVRGVRA